MEQTECSEMSAYKLQTPGNYPKESIQHTEHGESLKSRILIFNCNFDSFRRNLCHLQKVFECFFVTSQNDTDAYWFWDYNFYTQLSLYVGVVVKKRLSYRKVKGKGRFMELFNTAAVRPIVFLPLTISQIHLQRRHASYRWARSLPAKVGTITNEFY